MGAANSYDLRAACPCHSVPAVYGAQANWQTTPVRTPEARGLQVVKPSPCLGPAAAAAASSRCRQQPLNHPCLHPGGRGGLSSKCIEAINQLLIPSYSGYCCQPSSTPCACACKQLRPRTCTDPTHPTNPCGGIAGNNQYCCAPLVQGLKLLLHLGACKHVVLRLLTGRTDEAQPLRDLPGLSRSSE